MKQESLWEYLPQKEENYGSAGWSSKGYANQLFSSLVTLENHLLKELDVVLEQEKDLCALKSRINWMILGDRNTSFFHVSTLARRKRNLITAIKNEVGDWLTEEREVASYIREGFMKIYTTSQEVATWEINHNQNWQAKLSNEEKVSLSHMVTDEEIRTAFWSLKAFKALGPDGLHAGFFQRFWLIVGGSVRDEVHAIFRDRKTPDYLNRTNIVLIPKTQGPEAIGNYRLISLCNVVYKIVSKIIVGRI